MDSRAASTGTRSNPAPDPSITARLKLVTSRTPFPWAGLDPRVNDARLHTTKIGRPDLPHRARRLRRDPASVGRPFTRSVGGHLAQHRTPDRPDRTEYSGRDPLLQVTTTVRDNARRAAVLVGFSTFGVSPLQRTELADRAHACRCARRADGPRLFGPAGVIHPPAGRGDLL
jgi:hypothetical protein